MSSTLEASVYHFLDLVLVVRHPKNRTHSCWYIRCEYCGMDHVFRKQGPKLWHTSCEEKKIEWTITPSEFHVSKKCDLTSVLGGV
jgi:hypothetical protein